MLVLVLAEPMEDRHKAPSPLPLFPLSLHTEKTYPCKALWGPILLGVFGLGQVVAGIFVTGPSISFFPGTPGINPSTIHGVAGLFVFASLSAACFVLARRFANDPNWRGWRPYSIITGVVVAVFFVASIASSVLDERGILPGAPTGLLQRIVIIAGWCWVALLALRLLR